MTLQPLSVLLLVLPMVLVVAADGSQSPSSKRSYDNEPKDWTEKVLIKDLLRNYDRRSRPTVDGVTPVYKVNESISIQQITVEFGLSLIQIMKLDEMEQILTSNVRTLYRWTDAHLRWDTELYENITHVHIPPSSIWLPDISIYNYADERMEERRDCDVIVKYDGTVEWHPMAIFKSTCPVRIKYFPFDKQCCKLKFGPWTYDGFRVNITYYDNKTELDLSNYLSNAEWDLIQTHANYTVVKYVCCIEPYPDISFHVLVQRNSAFYNYILILPCFLLSSLTLVLFWLPAESPAKMVLGMNIFIAFFLLVVLLEKSIPSASSSFPMIGTYYCVNMTLITLSTFLCLIIVNFHFRGDNRKEAPYWLKQLTIKHGARILMVDLGPIMKKPRPLPPPVAVDLAQQLQQQQSSTSLLAPGPDRHPPSRHHNPSHNHRHNHRHNHHHHSHSHRHQQQTHHSNQQQDEPLHRQRSIFAQLVNKSSSTTASTAARQSSATAAMSGVSNHNGVMFVKDEEPSSYLRFTNPLRQQQQYRPDIREHSPPDRISGCHDVRCHDGAIFEEAGRYSGRPVTPGTEHSCCCSSASSATPPSSVDGSSSSSSSEGHSNCDEEEDVGRRHASHHMMQEDDDDEEDDRRIERDLNYPQLSSGTPVGLFSGGNLNSSGSCCNQQSQQHNHVRTGQFKDYEEDLEEFLVECVQSPGSALPRLASVNSNSAATAQQQLLGASWASYNSAAAAAPTASRSQSRSSDRNNHHSNNHHNNNHHHHSHHSHHNHHSCPPPHTRPGSASTPPAANVAMETVFGAAGGAVPNVFVARRVNLITKDINDIIKDLVFIQKNNENREKVNRIVSEWRAVGMVLDRFFFMIYVIAIVLSLIHFFPKAGNETYLNKNKELDCESAEHTSTP